MQGIAIISHQVGIQNDIILLRVTGYIDTMTSPELQKMLAQYLEQGVAQFIIDLSSVQYVSSAGWGVFVGEIRNIREKGGDLKIIHMNPEVSEVFEMLEFNRILNSYDTLEEAVDDFDFCRGLSNFFDPGFRMESSVSVLETPKPVVVTSVPQNVFRPVEMSRIPSTAPKSRSVEDAELPLSEKIKKLVVENPALGAWSIKKMLYSPRFGYTKIGFFKLRALMKRLGLESKTKRYRFYRSR